ncbi:MAG: XRE family transcriptional regulator [Gammaproteobacteria bacterium]|nr:XRE family transcriptional regulator [Gammaproteobacteria bacterium]
MTKKLDNIMNELPARRRRKIRNRAAELATLKDLRQAMQRTQEEMALALDIGQDSVSRLEKRSDMLLSTLRRYVEAMGGRLEIVAHFPDRPPVNIEKLSDADTESQDK